MEIIKAIRKKLGNNYPITVRLGACDYMEGGFTLQDGIGAANILEQAGIDLLDISGGFCGYVSPCCKGQGCFRVVMHAIKTA